jgi:helix-turn-helix protein
MGMDIESRPSDSPHVERVWRTRSSDVDRMTAIANAHWELVFWSQGGVASAAVLGPESRATRAPVPEDAEFFGISFALGTAMPHLPPGGLVDGSVPLPVATDGSFWLKGSAWRTPGFDDAELFVRKLVREGVVARDPVTTAALGDQAPPVTERTVQRHVVTTTGLTRGAIRRIERARQAVVLIQEGQPVCRVAHSLGYFDQPHLARSLSRFIGRTATQLAAGVPAEPMSLLYKT